MEDETTYLTQADVAQRWKISPQTLQRWRWWGKELCYFKVGRKVRYKLADIEKYEAKHSLNSTSQKI